MKGKENFWFESFEAIIIAYNENGIEKKNRRFVIPAPYILTDRGNTNPVTTQL